MGNRRANKAARKADVLSFDDEARNERGESRGQFGERLARGFEILKCFVSSDQHLTNQEIAQRTELPRPTVSRLTYTLTTLGYLIYSERDGTYALGAALLALARPLLSQSGILGLARPMVHRLANDTGFTVAIGRRVGFTIVYIEVVRGVNLVTLDIGVGASVSLLHSAMGRAYLAPMAAGERDTLLAELAGREGEDTAKVSQIMELAIQNYRMFGYCTTLGELHPDVNAAAVPLLAPGSSEVMPLVCGGPSYALTPALIRDDIGPRLHAIAQATSVVATPT